MVAATTDVRRTVRAVKRTDAAGMGYGGSTLTSVQVSTSTA